MMTLLERCRTKWNSLLLEISLNSGLNLGKPAYICAKMTMLCNSRCTHCNIWDMEFNEQELTAYQWFRILDELQGWLGSFRMTFTGGEALLREDMTDILAHAVGLGIKVELLSNGIAITDAVASRIVAAGIEQITISYDGVSPDVHDNFRGAAGYHASTTAGILSLHRCRQGSARPLRILLKTVINANNLHELADIARWAKGLNLNVQYQPIEQNYGEEPDMEWYKSSPLWVYDLSALQAVMAELRQIAVHDDTIINHASDFDRYYRYFSMPEHLMAAVQGHSFRSGKNACTGMGNFVISSNGDVRMCFRMEPFGNVVKTPPRELWRKRKRCWVGNCGNR
jgi:MoaA/NifB/PqqE/SkfB family radical SAM enzyme